MRHAKRQDQPSIQESIELDTESFRPQGLIDRQAKIRVIASNKTWIESSAVEQLCKAAELPGMRFAVGLPDLHPGKGRPIGAALASTGCFYPELVGTDIGCGMAFSQTTLSARKPKISRWSRRLKGLEQPWDGDAAAWLAERGLKVTGFEQSLGTIGGGNHFAELQQVERVLDPERFAELGLDPGKLQLLVHSGSRGFGESVLARFLQSSDDGSAGLQEGAGQRYLEQHDHAVGWARANRELIAERFLSQLGSGRSAICELPHNFLEQREIAGEFMWLHRKGAAPSDRGAVIIPGSRGSLSYLVDPTGELEASTYSLAHGAGRKWSRTSCRERLEHRYDHDKLSTTELGGHVICADRKLIFEEAPQAYRDISDIVETLRSTGLIRVIALFKPVLTYKVGGRSPKAAPSGKYHPGKPRRHRRARHPASSRQ